MRLGSLNLVMPDGGDGLRWDLHGIGQDGPLLAHAGDGALAVRAPRSSRPKFSTFPAATAPTRATTRIRFSASRRGAGCLDLPTPDAPLRLRSALQKLRRSPLAY
jgi:hypothetical protein